MKHVGGVVSLTGFVILSNLFLFVSSVSADGNDTTVDNIAVAVPVSCTLSGIGMNSHNARVPNGTYQSDIGSTTIKAFCNDFEGFAIYAAGYTGDEVGATNSNKLIGANLNQTIVTGTATSAGNPDTSNWSMKLATDGTATYVLTLDNGFGSYSNVPNSYTKVAHRDSGTDVGTNSTGASLTTTYAAYISKTQTADVYSGQVIYTLVHPASQNAPVACNPSGTTIGTNTGTDIKCMQDFASLSSSAKTTLIGAMTTGTQYSLMDKRDKKTYTIAKLADGKVWMTQNLDLFLDSSKTYTNLDTDLGWNGTSYSTASWTPLRSTYATTSTQTHEWCVGGTYSYGFSCEHNDTPESYDPGDLYWNGSVNNWSDWNTYFNTCDRSTSTPSCDESLNPLYAYTTNSGAPIQQYHLGNYYNWAAAIATNDASSYGAYNGTTGEYENQETSQSICPVGWTLPYASYNSSTNQAEGDFRDLWIEYGWNSTYNNFSDITDLTGAPIYFVQSGDFFGNVGYVGFANGHFASVARNDTFAFGAGTYVYGDAHPSDDGDRDNGFSVRCLLR